MFSFSNNHIQFADEADAGAITVLLNSAYRGASSRRGWTTEADLIAGDVRTDEANLLQVMRQQGSVFLKQLGAEGQIVGCVNLQQQQDTLYLGMFSVLPALQGMGVGRGILQAAEEYGRHLHCRSIYMSVISVRKELLDWYKRNGYEETGETKDFIEDDLTGKHLQQLQFLVLRKWL
ncbi:MAG: GNAT family N-acetyltransferase [Chitinophagaceae bacterium]|nr:MAG: GNAT family N-acetyltransferase [Chitinophagaceae bacterium]